MNAPRGWRAGGITAGCLLAGLAAGLWLGPDYRVARLPGYVVTMYFVPRTPAVGEQQLALRVQDRDYRLLKEIGGRLEVVELASRERRTVALKPGPGKDWRAWVEFPRSGAYQVLYVFNEASGQTQTARFDVRVPASR
jgi:hypothetical protein